jgi:hypothetical protein
LRPLSFGRTGNLVQSTLANLSPRRSMGEFMAACDRYRVWILASIKTLESIGCSLTPILGEVQGIFVRSETKVALDSHRSSGGMVKVLYDPHLRFPSGLFSL